MDDLVITLSIPNIPGGDPVFPNLTQAVKMIAAAAHGQWVSYAQGAPLPGGGTLTPRSGAYLKSIKLRQVDTLHWEVFSDAPYASAIEFGTAPYDLKQILQTSDRVRRTKTGKRYLIIPFRWGTGAGSGKGVSFGRQVMPAAIHPIAATLEASRIIGMGQRESGNTPGKMVPQSKYHWGGRLSFSEALGAGAGQAAARRMAGMVRFDSVGGGHSQYLTFRVMSEDSPGWIRPAQPGRYPARSAVDTLRPVAERAFAAALQLDVQAIVDG